LQIQKLTSSSERQRCSSSLTTFTHDKIDDIDADDDWADLHKVSRRIRTFLATISPKMVKPCRRRLTKPLDRAAD
jgi:hypothetical protein